MNDKTGYPGDIAFDDGVSRTSDGYYLVATNTANGSNTADVSIPNSRGCGLVVGFPPGSVLTQLSSSGDVAGGDRAYPPIAGAWRHHKSQRRPGNGQ